MKYYYAFIKFTDRWALYFPDFNEMLTITDPSIREDTAVTFLREYKGTWPKPSPVIQVINSAKNYITNQGGIWKYSLINVYQAVTR